MGLGGSGGKRLASTMACCPTRRTRPAECQPSIVGGLSSRCVSRCSSRSWAEAKPRPQAGHAFVALGSYGRRRVAPSNPFQASQMPLNATMMIRAVITDHSVALRATSGSGGRIALCSGRRCRRRLRRLHLAGRQERRFSLRFARAGSGPSHGRAARRLPGRSSHAGRAPTYAR